MKEQTKATEVKDFNEEEFEEEIVEETKPEKFSRTKAFFAKHKKTIGLAAAGVATTVASALILKNKMSEQYNAGYEDGLDHLRENATNDSEIEELVSLGVLEEEVPETDMKAEEN